MDTYYKFGVARYHRIDSRLYPQQKTATEIEKGELDRMPEVKEADIDAADNTKYANGIACWLPQ